MEIYTPHHINPKCTVIYFGMVRMNYWSDSSVYIYPPTEKVVNWR